MITSDTKSSLLLTPVSLSHSWPMCGCMYLSEFVLNVLNSCVVLARREGSSSCGVAMYVEVGKEFAVLPERVNCCFQVRRRF